MKLHSTNFRAVTGISTVIIFFAALIAGVTSSHAVHSTAAAQTIRDGGVKISAASVAEAFIITSEDGQVVCRSAAPQEAQAMMRREPGEKLRVITPQTEDLQQQQTGLKIILRGTPQLDGFPAARNAFIKAARVWESLIRNPITVVIDVDYGPTRFGEPYRPNTVGATLGQLLGSGTIYPGMRSALISRASSAGELALYNTLPNATVPTDLGSTAGVNAQSPLLRALGFINAAADPDMERAQFGPPPSIGFNSAMSFDFDPADGIADGRLDFDTTAIHEIGHVLGFTSNVGVRELDMNAELRVSLWDLFRFRPGVNSTTFVSAQRILSSGGDHAFFDGGAALALSTGKPDGTGGDGKQASHWKDDSLSGTYLGTMDPSIAAGERDLLTENDLRAIDVMGYQLRTSATQQTLELKVDDGSVEGGIRNDGLLVVNRLTPTNYPATLQSIRVQFRTFQGQPDPTGAPIMVVLFTDPSGSGQPPSGAPITRLNSTVPGTSSTSFFEFQLTNGPTINSGDFYVGFSAPTPNQGVGFPLDTNGQAQNRSFLSLNNGGTFSPIAPPPGTTSANAVIRAVVSSSEVSAPAVQTAPSSFDFGNVPAGNTSERLLLIRNTGNAILNITNISSSNSRFRAMSITNSFVIAPGSQESIAVRFSPVAAGSQTGTLTFATNDPARANITIQLAGNGGGTVRSLASVSAASFSGPTLASEAIVAAFGQNLATRLEVATTLPLPTSLAGTTVKVRDSAGVERNAPLFFVSPGQVNYLIPANTAVGSATITTTSGDGTVSTGAVNIAPFAPGLFTANANGQGVASAVALRVRTNGTQVFEAISRFDSGQNRFVPVPIDLGPEGEQVFLILFGTGIRFHGNLQSVSAKLDNLVSEVAFAGPQGGFEGLDQVNLRLSRTLIGRGEIDLILTVDVKTANTVRVHIR
jgi:uncharacterized protein (TIGR03437 family)